MEPAAKTLLSNLGRLAPRRKSRPQRRDEREPEGLNESTAWVALPPSVQLLEGRIKSCTAEPDDLVF